MFYYIFLLSLGAGTIWWFYQVLVEPISWAVEKIQVKEEEMSKKVAVLSIVSGVVIAVVVAALFALGVPSFSASSKGSQEYVDRQAARTFRPVVEANENLSKALRENNRRESGSAVHKALEVTTETEGAFSVLGGLDNETRGEFRAALHQETNYLNVVKATLRNPTSPEASQVQSVSATLIGALDKIDPPVRNAASSVSGMSNLTAWATRAARRQRRKEAVASTPTPVTVNPAPSAPRSTGTNCDDGTYAGANTSCALAANVRSEYYEVPGTDVSVTAYSPSTGNNYDFWCDGGGGTVVCTGSGNPGPLYVSWGSSDSSSDATPDPEFSGMAHLLDGSNYLANGRDDLDCSDIRETNFPTPPVDEDNIDPDNNGVACEV